MNEWSTQLGDWVTGCKKECSYFQLWRWHTCQYFWFIVCAFLKSARYHSFRHHQNSNVRHVGRRHCYPKVVPETRVIFLGQIKLILHCPLPVLRVGFFKLQVFYDIREIFCLPIFKSSRAFYLQWWLVIPTKYQVLEIFGGKWSIKVSFLWFKKGLIFACI